MKQQDLTLLKPTMKLKEEFLEMVNEFLDAGDILFQGTYSLIKDDFAAYLRKVEDAARGKGLPAGYVPSTAFWMVKNDTRIIGAIWLRDYLTPALENEGGHIGYNIRPSERGKGYGTIMLELCCDKARVAGMDRVMVTCDTDNVASARVIEKNGGILESQGVSIRTGKQVNRYWIEL